MDSLLQSQKVDPIIGRETVVRMLDQWAVFLAVILVLSGGQTTVYDLSILIKAVAWINERLRAQICHQLLMLEALIQIIQTYFDESSWQFLMSSLIVRCPQLTSLACTLTTGNFIT